MARPFQMWLFPIPALVAAVGFLYILVLRNNALKEIRYAAVLVIVGLIIYCIRAWWKKDWPFGVSEEHFNAKDARDAKETRR